MNRFLSLAIISMLVILFPVIIFGQSSDPFYLLVGTYTSEESKGIYVYEFDAETGEATYVSKAVGVENPSYLAISPDENYVYAVNETGGEEGGYVSSFSFDKQEGELTFLNKKSSKGDHPCYVSVDATGQAVFAGNYSGGSLSMLPIESDGALAEPETTIPHTGSSVNEARQENPHVHCTYVAPDNKRLFVADLGTDTVTGYAFDDGEVKLDSKASSTFETTPGAGPRHLTFHLNGDFAYLINELNGTINAFTYEEGRLNGIQEISTLPEDYEGAVSGADIHVSPDGKFLYASNREDLNNIVIYSIDQETGQLQKIGQSSSGGVHPRNFMIDPTGRYLLVANRNSDNIVVFERNKETGLLSETGTELEISMPVCLKMMSAH